MSSLLVKSALIEKLILVVDRLSISKYFWFICLALFDLTHVSQQSSALRGLNKVMMQEAASSHLIKLVGASSCCRGSTAKYHDKECLFVVRDQPARDR